jgi:hypothetical protein
MCQENVANVDTTMDVCGRAWGMFGMRVHGKHNMNTFMVKQRLDNLRRKSSAQRSGNSRVSVHLCNDSASNIEGSAIALRIRTGLEGLERHDASLYLPGVDWELLPHHGQPSRVHFL